MGPTGDYTTEETMIARVLVPLDGSELAEAALRRIPGLFGELDLVLFRATVPPDELISAYLPDTVRTTREMTEARQRAAEEYLEKQREAIEGRARTVEIEIRPTPDPAREIVRVAEERRCDLVAMSSHGRSGLTRALLGSVTDRVLRRSAVPVLVIPPGSGGDESRSTL